MKKVHMKYGKSYSDMWKFKTSLTEENEHIVRRDNTTREKYKNQPLRIRCKVCDSDRKAWSFEAHGVEYYICGDCGHLNGAYSDTEEFCSSIYENAESDYGFEYNDVDQNTYNDRVQSIYLPKAKFIQEVFSEQDMPVDKLNVLDIGAGTGHFVKALEDCGISAVGVEVDQKQANRARRYLLNNRMSHIPSEEVANRIKEAKENLVSFIYCLEHIANLYEILDAVESNKNIEYIYIAVPMFSYSLMIGLLNDDIMDRLLGGGEHSHLFTNESIAWLCRNYRWEIMGEWRFGADVADLLRTVTCKLSMNANGSLANYFSEKMIPILDDLQLVMDKEKFCSDIHILVKKSGCKL